MKKIVLVLIVILTAAACTSNSNENISDDSAVLKSTEIDSLKLFTDTVKQNITEADTQSLIHDVTKEHVALSKNDTSVKQEPATKKDIVKSESSQEPRKSNTADEYEPSTLSATDINEGKLLITKSDCLACHKTDQKLVGPAYEDVAEKYNATDANIKYLTNKIYQGGSGVWGELPMTPHHALSQDDIKKMVKYILSLRKSS